MSDTFWLLSCECNDYDQHGSYHIAVFKTKPTYKDLNQFEDLNNKPDLINHILEGGGRTEKNEWIWYNLDEYFYGQSTQEWY